MLYKFRQFILVILLIALSPTLLFAAVMSVHRPEDTYISSEGKMFAYDSSMMELEEAGKVAEYIFKAYGSGKYPYIYKMPGYDNFYVVTAKGYHGEKDGGIRFFLIKARNGRLRRLQTTRGAGESYILSPTFFFNNEHMLILAEIGGEFSRGFSVYSFDSGRAYLKSLGTINVAKPAEMFDGMTSPIDFIQVVEDEGKYEIKISGDIVVDPGGPDEKEYIYSGKSFSFVRIRREFVFMPPEGKKE